MMKPQHYLPQKMRSLSTLCTGIFCIGITILSSPAAAGEKEVIQKVLFNPPGSGAPPDTRGGGSRGDLLCSTEPEAPSKRLSLLTPFNSNFGLTVSDRPTFFAYIPSTSASALFFNLKDEAGRVHYQSVIPLMKQSGVLALELPKDTKPLDVGKRYQWSIAILCSGRLRPDSPFAEGWVQRISADTSHATKASLKLAALYGNNGIWYDALTTLADLRRQEPRNAALISTWGEFLQSAGLGAIAQEPLL